MMAGKVIGRIRPLNLRYAYKWCLWYGIYGYGSPNEYFEFRATPPEAPGIALRALQEKLRADPQRRIASATLILSGGSRMWDREHCLVLKFELRGSYEHHWHSGSREILRFRKPENVFESPAKYNRKFQEAAEREKRARGRW